MTNRILAAIAVVAVSVGLAAAQPASAAQAPAYGQAQQTGPYAAGGTAYPPLGGN